MEKREPVPRGLRALVVVLGALVMAVAASPAFASTTTTTVPSSTTTSTTTTTLPSIPTVSPTYTDNQSAPSLLSKAIELSSVGIDSSALTSAIDVTQAKMDQDASIASKAANAAAAADTRARQETEMADAATAEFTTMSSAVRQAVVFLYTTGSAPVAVNPRAGTSALFAQDYAYSALSPYGILQTSEEQAAIEKSSQKASKLAASIADRESAKAAKALAAEQSETGRLERELSSISSASAIEVAADHLSLANQAGTELLSATALQFTPSKPIPAPLSTTPVALTWAFAELGKEYVWGATGPNTFDCSGLTQFVWRAAGVTIPRVAAAQDEWTIPVPLSDLLPGDLVFYGRTDIHHVGIYIGDGLMINAPHTGTVVQVSSIWWSDLAGFGRVHDPDVPIPSHQAPSVAKPVAPIVVATAGPVPSQTKPPPGWKPKPGSTTPILPPDGKWVLQPGTTTTTLVPQTTTTTLTPSDTTGSGADSTTTSTTATTSTTTTTIDPDSDTTTTSVSPDQ